MAFSIKTRALPTAGEPVRRKGSVQRRYVGVQEVREHMLCLRASHTDAASCYRAVLELQGINLLLKSEREQLVLTERYQQFLAGLTYPLQVFLRITPLSLVSLLAGLRASSSAASLSQIKSDPHQELAEAQRAFLRNLSNRRPLLERHLYLIVPADQPTASRAFAFAHPLLCPQRAEARLGAGAFEHARAQLDLRVAEITRQLQPLGIGVRQLSDQELLHLYARCLVPERTGTFPSPESVLAGSQAMRDQRCGVQNQGACPPLWDLLAPSWVWLQPDALCIEGTYQRVLAIDALPRFVPVGFMHPLAQWEEPLSISLFYQPADSEFMIQQLVRKRTDYQSTLRAALRAGHLQDPQITIAHHDVEDLIAKLASGEERMLSVSCYLLVHGASVQDLEERVDRLRSTLQQLLLVARSATFEQDLAVRSCLPEGRNLLGRSLLLDSRSAAFATFLCMRTTLLMPDGILEGVTAAGDPVVLDWWHPEQRNANRLIAAPSGTGKSYKCKLDLARMYLRYVRPGEEEGLTFQALVIDPEREYQAECAALHGQWIRLAPGAHDHLNPLDLPHVGPARQRQQHLLVETDSADVLADTIQQVHAFLEIALADRGPGRTGSLSSQEKGLLDRVLYQVYREAGISSDPATHQRTPPLLQDVYRLLEQKTCGADPTDLAGRLRRFVHGSLSGLFAGQTTLVLTNPLVVFDVRDLEAELRAIAYFLIARHVWNVSMASTIPRLLIIDELLSLYAHPEGARFLECLFQRARKHYLGVLGVTQHIGLLRQSTIPSNCATKILMAQEPENLEELAELFHLSEHEIHLLSRCGKGDALLLTQQQRVFVHFEASALEHRLATTDPRELARWEQEAAEQPSSDQQSIIQPLYRAGRPVRGLPRKEPPAHEHDRPLVDHPPAAIAPARLQGHPPSNGEL